jgi:hypothetical protein
MLFAFLSILLGMGLVALMGSSMTNMIVAVAVFSILAFARLVRVNTLALKHLTYYLVGARHRCFGLGYHFAAYFIGYPFIAGDIYQRAGI